MEFEPDESWQQEKASKSKSLKIKKKQKNKTGALKRQLCTEYIVITWKDCDVTCDVNDSG